MSAQKHDEQAAGQHTPGPWINTPSGSVMEGYSQPFAIGQYGKPNLVAGCFGDVAGGIETARANARLIASAPDLLEACRIALVLTIAPSSDTYASDVEKIRAAIAKATP